MVNFKLKKTFESREGKTWVYENGYVETETYEDTFLDVPFLLNAKRELEKTGIRKFYVLSRGAGTYRISKEAKELAATKEYNTHIGAVAVIANTVTMSLIVETYNKINKPAVPTKVFTDKERAKQWLLAQMGA